MLQEREVGNWWEKGFSAGTTIAFMADACLMAVRDIFFFGGDDRRKQQLET